MITIGSARWDVPCKVTRAAEMRPSDISGMLLDRTYFNDVLGTYMQYDVVIAVPFDRLDDYYDLYETITSPADGLTVTMPYNDGTVEVTGRIESIRDEMVRVPGGQYWKGISFTIKANHPTKEVSLGEAITIGKSPLPEAVSVPVGTYYVMTASGWEPADISDADDTYY